MGVGCIVWYGFAQGPIELIPTFEQFRRVPSYDPFFNPSYESPILLKAVFSERSDAPVAAAFSEGGAFSAVSAVENIPAAELTSVGLGVMV